MSKVAFKHVEITMLQRQPDQEIYALYAILLNRHTFCCPDGSLHVTSWSACWMFCSSRSASSSWPVGTFEDEWYKYRRHVNPIIFRWLHWWWLYWSENTPKTKKWSLHRSIGHVLRPWRVLHLCHLCHLCKTGPAGELTTRASEKMFYLKMRTSYSLPYLLYPLYLARQQRTGMLMLLSKGSYQANDLLNPGRAKHGVIADEDVVIPCIGCYSQVFLHVTF